MSDVSNSNSASRALDPRLKGSDLFREPQLIGRVSTPLRCLFDNIKELFVPTNFRYDNDKILGTEEKSKSKDTNPVNFAIDTGFDDDSSPDVISPSTDVKPPEIDEKTERALVTDAQRNRANFLGEDLDGVGVEFKNRVDCRKSGELGLSNPYSNNWVPCCPEHSRAVRLLVESASSLLGAFRTLPDYPRNESLKSKIFAQEVNAPENRMITNVKRHLRRVRRERNKAEKTLVEETSTQKDDSGSNPFNITDIDLGL